MSQDNPNEPIVAEEPQTSDQIHAERVEPTVAQPTVEPELTEAAIDDAAGNVVEEEIDAEDAPLDETPETSSPAEGDATDVASSASALPSSESTSDVDDRCAIEKQPYDFDHCTVQIALQLLPDDGNANGRMVVVGVRSHLDAPILRVTRLNELGTLPPLVSALLGELKAELPTRERAAREALEKKKAEQAQRKSIVTAKTARGKKSKASPATVAASSNATTPDSRPRPEVQVTTAPQQQRGLF